MELKDFINKPVISTHSGRRFVIHRVTAPKIEVMTAAPDRDGHYTFYSYPTINGDPISTGALVFEDKTLTAPFLASFDAHSRSEDGYWEEFDYWMRKD